MARISGKSTDIYIDHFQYDTYANSFTFTISPSLPEVTAFADEGATFVEGKPNFTLDLNAFFDGADNQSDEITSGIESGSSQVLVVPSGLTTGNIGYDMTTQLSSRGIDNPVDGATALNVSSQGTSSSARSMVLYTPSQTPFDGTGAVAASRVDTGSTSPLGSRAAGTIKTATLRITAVSGSGTATVKIQDSSNAGWADGTGFSDFLAFAQISAVGTQTVNTTDAMDRYLQINVTQYAGFTNVTCLVTLGIEVG
tara:strand:+ start:2584 stop:3345 length:762 start_codon:yes stop_codon:yes gene_type:complete